MSEALSVGYYISSLIPESFVLITASSLEPTIWLFSAMSNLYFYSSLYMASLAPPSLFPVVTALQLLFSLALLYNSINYFWIRSKRRISLLKFYYESLWFISLNTSFNSVKSSNSSPLKPRYEDIFRRQTGQRAKGF